ncbi:hypothetical protein AYL99_00006 [Fonsecaea erecta]|uniref:Transcription factor domain-containing protein n=1 Tax=Fonsecaea erecta TaxID=1367422 RepID=A0A178ZW98_9EURO|nr:hypothetical protein AYL99_00006 [Fonsecaea erecta]OAP64034.1 hypothetical protein AYL99_00006 [Fonsecaea erecta]
MPLTESEKLAVSLISALDGPAQFGQRLQHMGSHFRQLPVRLGRSRALDAAVSCFMYSFTAASGGLPRDQSLELARYCTAIATLRQEMSCSNLDGSLSTSSETLCASLLLAQYEILKPGPTYSYIQLAGGVSAILKGSGPSRVTSSEFELAIFTTQYPTIITQSMLRGEECFLNDPQWMDAMRRSNGHESPIVSELWTALARVPDLFVQANALGGVPPSCGSSPLYAGILSQIYDIRSAIVAYSDAITRNLSTPGVFATFPAAYRGPHPVPEFHPQTDLESLQANCSIQQATFYYACVIYINAVLQNFLVAHNPALSPQTSQAATSILSTLEFSATTRPFGSFFMTFAGPLCYGVLSDPLDKEVLVQGMNTIFDEVGISWTHFSLQEIFYALTRGGWSGKMRSILSESEKWRP